MSISTSLKNDIKKSIKECELCSKVEGSRALYNKLIAKYVNIFPNFKEGLPKARRAATQGGERDFRPVIKAIAVKLKKILDSEEFPVNKKTQNFLRKVDELIREGATIIEEEYHDSQEYLEPDFVAGPKYDRWALEVENFSQRYLISHPLFTKVCTLDGQSCPSLSEVQQVINCLQIIAKDDDFLAELEGEEGGKTSAETSSPKQGKTNVAKNAKVFLVHGHDEAMKQTVARTLERAGLEAIILHEKPNEVATIIEKIEKYADVAFAIVLYSPCDIGRAKENSTQPERLRARQNVVFEHGYLNGRLGRKSVCAIVNGDIEKPGDIDGVVYIDFDGRGAWKAELGRELKKANLVFDFEKLVC